MPQAQALVRAALVVGDVGRLHHSAGVEGVASLVEVGLNPPSGSPASGQLFRAAALGARRVARHSLDEGIEQLLKVYRVLPTHEYRNA